MPERAGCTLGGQGTRVPAHASLPEDRPQPGRTCASPSLLTFSSSPFRKTLRLLLEVLCSLAGDFLEAVLR